VRDCLSLTKDAVDSILNLLLITLLMKNITFVFHNLIKKKDWKRLPNYRVSFKSHVIRYLLNFPQCFHSYLLSLLLYCP
jgi:hypothetical protein